MVMAKTTTKNLSQFGQENVMKLGQQCVEMMKETPSEDYSNRWEKFCQEKFKTSSETLNVGESSLYTTAIAGFIEKRLRPQLVAENVIKEIQFNTKGQDTLKIPKRGALISASDLPDDGSVSYDGGSFGSTSVQLRYSYAANKITHELLAFSNVDLISEELGEIGYALSRKVDSDIISAFDTNTGTASGNATNLGTGTTITFDKLVDAHKSARENYANPNAILMSPETYATILKLDEFSGGNSITGAVSMQGDNGSTFPQVVSIFGMRVVISNQVDDDHIYMIDTERNGYLVRSGNVETFDDRVSGALAYEVIGALNYGIGIVQPNAIYKVQENTAA